MLNAELFKDGLLLGVELHLVDELGWKRLTNSTTLPNSSRCQSKCPVKMSLT